MFTFNYKMVTPENTVVRGTTQGLLASLVTKSLEKEGNTVLFIQRQNADFLKMEISFLSKTFPALERIAFFRNFSSMISSGMPMVIILETLSKQVKSAKMRDIIMQISVDVKNGTPLSAAMAKYSEQFPAYVTETIRVGELGGLLGEVLDRIANDFERNYELRKKVKGAIAYPVIVVVVLVVVLVGLVALVLPQIAELFSGFGAEPPFLTRVLFNTSEYMRAHPIFLLSVFGTIVAFLVATYKHPKGKYFFHSMMMKLPVFGILIKEFNVSLFFRSLSSLSNSGVSLVQGVEVSKKTLRNSVYQKAISDVHPLLVYGSPLSEVLEPYPDIFPIQMQQMVQVGEKSGRLGEVFEHVVRHYERSVNHRTQMMTTLLEPILMLVVGVAVGLLALSIFMPIYQVATLI